MRDDSLPRPPDRAHAAGPGPNLAATYVEHEETNAQLLAALERLVERFDDARPPEFVTLASATGKRC